MAPDGAGLHPCSPCPIGLGWDRLKPTSPCGAGLELGHNPSPPKAQVGAGSCPFPPWVWAINLPPHGARLQPGCPLPHSLWPDGALPQQPCARLDHQPNPAHKHLAHWPKTLSITVQHLQVQHKFHMLVRLTINTNSKINTCFIILFLPISCGFKRDHTQCMPPKALCPNFLLPNVMHGIQKFIHYFQFQSVSVCLITDLFLGLLHFQGYV